MPGPWADDFHEGSDHYTTKIGGLPDWPIGDLGIVPEVLNCGLCGERLCLVAQVYAPISMPKYNIEERMIYVLACRMPKCGSNPRSWRAIRVQKCQDKEQLPNANHKAMTQVEDSGPVSKHGNWWVEGLSSFEDDDDDSDDVDLEKLGQSLADASSQASQSKNRNISKHFKDADKAVASKPTINDVDANMPVVPCFYIYSQKAHTPNEVSAVCANYSELSIKGNDSSCSDHEDEKWEGETYEYDRALGADRTYLKFKKHLDKYPEQCLRYSYGGRPLFATTNMVSLDVCRQCGSSRHFEMQLMPPLLYFLHQAADGSSSYVPEEWSWLTLIIYTCSSSCCPLRCTEKSRSCCWAVAEETIIIQYE